MKIAITGGGSGGHTLPAVTIYDELVGYFQTTASNEKFNCIYIGSKDGIENQVANNKNIPFHYISTGKLRRYFSLKNISDILRIIKGIFDSYSILKTFKADILFSTGGFVSVPVVIASKILSIPVIIHEQTTSVGLANKIASYFALKIAISFPSAKKYFPESKVIHTGQPIRKELFTGSKDECYKIFNLNKNLPLIYITGGSQGSHKINTTFKPILKDLLQLSNIIHQCGKTDGHNDFQELNDYKQSLPDSVKHHYIIKDFINTQELKHILNGTDLLIGRSGAGTVSEVLALAIPSIFIPLPSATRNEQYTNARMLEEISAAQIINENTLNPELLKESIINLIINHKTLTDMKKNIKKISMPSANNIIVELLISNKKTF